MTLYKDEFDSWQELEDALDLAARLENAGRDNGEAQLSIENGERITIEIIEETVAKATSLPFEEVLEEYKLAYINALPDGWKSIYGEELKYRRADQQLSWKERLQLPVELLFN
jgi:hypothetical protein